jgi:CelD/BcsL family acetyltransferase involved in cellulose biosynthesis
MRHDPAKTPLSVERLDASALAGLDAAAWDALSANALVENPFYAREVVLAALATIDSGTELEALAVKGGEGGSELLGLFPYRLKHFPFKTAEAACNLYQFSSTPLIRRDAAKPVLGAWLDAALHDDDLPRFWQFKHADLGSALMPVLDAALAERFLDKLAVNTYRRPHLTRVQGGFEAHRQCVLRKRRLKDIKRNLRRLGALGAMRFERASEPALVGRRLEQFLALENAGWKGAASTAFLAGSDHAAFARAAFAPRADGKGLVSIDSLLLDETPIAMSLNLQARDTAFTPKCAYDERYRRFSPGLVLEYLIIQAFYEGGAVADMDAATTQDGHVLAGLWNGYKTMGTLVVGPGDWRLRAIASFAERMHASRELAKSVLGRGQAQPPAKAARASAWAKGGMLIPWALGLAAAFSAE